MKMQETKKHGLKGAVVVLAAVVMAVLAMRPAGATPVIKIDGSSTVYPITEAVAEEFQKAQKGAVRVTVGIAGTGGGFKKFCRGDTDISDASRPILAKERADCRTQDIDYIELPVAYDALTVVVNPANPVNSITVAELKKMWNPTAQGVVKSWKQVNPQWSDAPLKLYGPGADSGTFDYFTEVVVGKSKSSRGDFTASEDDNVLVQGVANDKNALGYFGLAYYGANAGRLKALAVDGGKGPVLPSVENAKNGSYTPLSRPLFIYVSKKSLARPEVRAFVDFYLAQAAVLSAQVKYVPLPADAYQMVVARLRAGKAGTVFTGKAQAGMTVTELLQREPKR